jgi:hypothetical protein
MEVAVADTRQPRRPARDTPGRSADDPEIIDLIKNVRSARTNLNVDLSAAAGALDAGQLEVARDILDSDQRDLAGFASETKQILAAATDDAAVPEPRQPRRSRARLLLALPAVPFVGAVAMTAAAALGGTGHAAHHTVTPTVHQQTVVASAPTHESTPVTVPTADSTLQRLEHVVSHHPKAAQVLAVADDLHQQLTQMIRSSKNNPQRLSVVRQLLTLEQRVLEGNNAPGSTVALAASREIAQLLSTLPTTVVKPTTAATSKPSPTATTPTTTTTTAPGKAPTTQATSPTTKHHPTTTPSASHQPKKPKKWFDPLHFPNVFNFDL